MSGGVTTDGLPAGWAWATTAELGDIRLGRQRSPKHQSGDFPTKYLRAANLTWNGLDLSDVLEMNFRPEELSIYRLEPGDVLLSEASGSAAEVGKAVVWRGAIPDCCFQNTVIRFRPRHVSPEFAQQLFTHYARSGVFTQASKGVGIHHLSADRFSKLRCPLPPLAEQRRIVAKVEELFSDLGAGVAALERVRANLKRYRAAVLKAAVEGRLTADWRAAHPDAEPASALLARILADRRAKWEADQRAKFAASGKPPPKNWQAKYAEPMLPNTANLPSPPEGWCWATVDQLISHLRNGYFQSPSNATAGHRILRINAVRPMSVDLDEVRFLPQLAGDGTGYLVEDGDLLFTRYNGSVDLLGVAGMVRGCNVPTLHPDKLIRVRTVLPQPHPAYLELAANVGESRRHMVGRARTTAGQTGISGTDVREMPVPLPSPAEQAAIVAEVEERLSVVAAVERQVAADVARAARLRQAILKRAFAGRLVPQDPADESADMLLERIRAGRPFETRQQSKLKGAQRAESPPAPMSGANEDGNEGRRPAPRPRRRNAERSLFDAQD